MTTGTMCYNVDQDTVEDRSTSNDDDNDVQNSECNFIQRVDIHSIQSISLIFQSNNQQDCNNGKRAL